MKIFLSHIHEETKIAFVLKEWIESTFAGQIQVFVSSDVKDIPVGSKWFTEIDNALTSSSLFVMLCSSTSILRPWINFESGCAWIKQVPLMPLCHSGLKGGDLPSPLSIFQAIEVEADNFIDDFFNSIKNHFNISKLPRIDKKLMLTELRQSLDLIDKTESLSHVTRNKEVNPISDEDALNTIESWMGGRDASLNTRIINYSDVDLELSLPEGTAKRLIEQAASRWRYAVRRKGEKTILFENIPRPPIRRRSSF